MIDKVTLGSLVAVGVTQLLAQAVGGESHELPGLGSVTNMTATGALIFLVLWMTTRTLPAIVKDFREEMKEVRAERDKERERVICRHQPDDDGHR